MPRYHKYVGEQERVFTAFQRPDARTLQVVPGEVFVLHQQHDDPWIAHDPEGNEVDVAPQFPDDDTVVDASEQDYIEYLKSLPQPTAEEVANGAPEPVDPNKDWFAAASLPSGAVATPKADKLATDPTTPSVPPPAEPKLKEE